jgi:polyhydroxybutyrate depolymerase
MSVFKTIRFWMVLAAALAAGRASALAAPEVREWTVDGVKREALIYRPEGKPPAGGVPVVFAFHGHGGGMRQAARSFALEEQWPAAGRR